MKRWRRVITASMLINSLMITPVSADWKLESQNSPTGLTAYASSYWIDKIGPVNFAGLLNYQVPNDTYFGTLLLQCSKKKLVVSFTLMQTGSAHENPNLDDPGYMQIYFQGNGLNKRATYRTFGLGLEGTLAINLKTQEITKYLMKSRTASMQFVKRDGVKLNAVFDVRDLNTARTRFAYAGCKI